MDTKHHKHMVHTTNAPEAIGTYSQAIQHYNTIYISGQLPIDKSGRNIIGNNFEEQAAQVLKNLKEVCTEAGGSLCNLAKISVFLLDLDNYSSLNKMMVNHLQQPYPARVAIEVKRLPRDALILMDAIMVL